jgi:hypothetical protein
VPVERFLRRRIRQTGERKSGKNEYQVAWSHG